MPALPVLEETDQDKRVFLTVIRQVFPTLTRLDDGRLIKRIGEERFKDSCDELFGYIEAGISCPLNRLEKDALASKIIACLKDYMTHRMQMPFTLKTMIDCISLIPISTDDAFPQYHACKLMKFMIR